MLGIFSYGLFLTTYTFTSFTIWRCTSSSLSSTLLLDFSLTVKAATVIFISGRGSAISSAMEGKSGFIYNLVKSLSAFWAANVRAFHENPNRMYTH